MKKLEDISVTFIWGGKAVTAFADVDYKTHKIDIGPEGYREHVMAYVPYDMTLSRISVCHGDKNIENPEADLMEFAGQLLLEKADDILCEKV